MSALSISITEPFLNMQTVWSSIFQQRFRNQFQPRQLTECQRGNKQYGSKFADLNAQHDRLTSATEIDQRRHENIWSSENANKRRSEKRKEGKAWTFEIISGHSTCSWVRTLLNLRQLSCEGKRRETRKWKLFCQMANRQSRVRKSGSFNF